ncbi:LytTR family DNA-binding domain-containing protein [uncultured Polaribacter sp.]|uniref:LytR/AlgR family response regulator transcription factor n=1 Tax=uncultured Polaribacter sp. TaxID=174711 RepID=UPI002631ACF4|nr:LytTR family DNA-binding domain-containing protein [uncultured Polaribacter sp.]
MKLSAIIIDDDNQSTKALSYILKKHASNTIKVVATSDNTKEAEDLINQLQPTLLFLDIQLDIGTSFDLLRKIKPYNYIVVFVTSHKEFILESFNYNAVYYIVKPINIKEVTTSVTLAYKQYQLQNFTGKSQIKKIESIIHNLEANDHKKFLEIYNKTAKEPVSYIRQDFILYCESKENFTQAYLIDGRIQISEKNIDYYEEKLSSKYFSRIHKNFLVNLSQVESIIKEDGNYCKLHSGKLLSLAKNKTSEIYQKINLVD